MASLVTHRTKRVSLLGFWRRFSISKTAFSVSVGSGGGLSDGAESVLLEVGGSSFLAFLCKASIFFRIFFCCILPHALKNCICVCSECSRAFKVCSMFWGENLNRGICFCMQNRAPQPLAFQGGLPYLASSGWGEEEIPGWGL